MSNWYAQETGEVLLAFGVKAEVGLSSTEVSRRIGEYGLNELVDRGMKSPWRILWEQFTATMVLILIAAAGVSAILGKATETISILAIVMLFGLLGFIQEYRAEKAMAALKKMSVPQARVRRGSAVITLPARELAPGDVLLLEAGNVVPADGRIIESVNLRILEAVLTGESEPVEKVSSVVTGNDLPIGDRRNMGYMGTVVTYGRGTMLVTNTGMNAELGKIASALQSTHREQTPLQKRLDQLGKALAVVGVITAILVILLGLMRGEELRELFLSGVSVAVAVVPEGLPAVVTFTLALGARRMLKRNALIRKLPAVETLGSVTVICTDKTGTLTENRMTVVVLDVEGHRLEIDEKIRNRNATFDQHQPTTVLDPPASMRLMAVGGALCNDAILKPDAQAHKYHAIGDPTEGAMLVVAAQLGMLKEQLDAQLPRLAELPFDSERKRMTTVHQRSQYLDKLVGGLPGSTHIGFTKGSVDGLLHICTHVWSSEGSVPMTETYHLRVETANNAMAQQGLRVLGVAFKPLNMVISDASVETEMVFIGLVGIIDPPRAEVKAAIQTCITAGIRPIMITGDHPLTAGAIAQQLGIITNSSIITGRDLTSMSDEDLRAAVKNVSVFARVSPEHKLRIVSALQSQNQVVAMTGDGVNDAPALKRADIGVAMGITGSDVSKEAADMVLLDDNFATIVSAVAEGRTIYSNVRRFVKFSIAGNIGKIAVMLLAPLMGMPIALLPLQLLWLNLLTDGLLGLGMGVEPAERDTMRLPPRSPSQGIFGEGMGKHILWLGALISVISIGVGFYYWQAGSESWQTMIFTTLAFSQAAQALAVRSTRDSLFKIGIFTNTTLLIMAIAVVIMQMGVLYLPFLEQFFNVTPLAIGDLLICAVLGSLVFAAIEFEKALVRRKVVHSA